MTVSESLTKGELLLPLGMKDHIGQRYKTIRVVRMRASACVTTCQTERGTMYDRRRRVTNGRFSPAQRDRNRPRENPYTSSEFTTVHRLCDSVAPLDRTKDCPDAPSGDGIRERSIATFLKLRASAQEGAEAEFYEIYRDPAERPYLEKTSLYNNYGLTPACAAQPATVLS
ncbi:hypothetical protein BGY98DRAFT_935792 [Russula aff. rugulosa BPL654]|nr:hypothetical protein BGY98DRAFT_935792 [Russula aff. rugulosa BPL654]